MAALLSSFFFQRNEREDSTKAAQFNALALFSQVHS